MKAILSSITILAALVGFSAAAAAADLHPTSVNGATYISGGVGHDEQQYLRHVAGDYNLRLTFVAKHHGAYISDVKVTIRDARGDKVLSAKADGPMFFARLAPGDYKVIMAHNGKDHVKQFHISPRHSVADTIAWSNVRFGSEIHCC